MLSVADIDQETVTALVATLLFRGEWQSKFDADRTHKDVFYSSSRATMPCTMMQQEAHFRYYSEDGWVYVVLPFQEKGSCSDHGVQFAFEVILPQEDVMQKKSETIQQEYTRFVQRARAQAEYKYIDFSMPKFSLKNRLELKSLCQSLGIQAAFENQADFSKMSSTPLVIQKLFQEVQLVVNEEGAEVAAATVATMKMRAVLPRTPDYVVRLNRPFYAILRAHQDEIPILFAHITQVE